MAQTNDFFIRNVTRNRAAIEANKISDINLKKIKKSPLPSPQKINFGPLRSRSALQAGVLLVCFS